MLLPCEVQRRATGYLGYRRCCRAGPHAAAEDLTVADRSAVPAFSASSLVDTAEPAGVLRDCLVPSPPVRSWASSRPRLCAFAAARCGLQPWHTPPGLLAVDLYKSVVKQRRFLSANGLIGLRPGAPNNAATPADTSSPPAASTRRRRPQVGRAHSGSRSAVSPRPPERSGPRCAT